MKTIIVKGQAIADRIHAETAKRIVELKKRGVTPKLAVVLVGDDQASRMYTQMKQKKAESLGIVCELHTLHSSVSKKDLIAALHEIQSDPQLCGLLVQIPLPEPLYTTDVLNAIAPRYDIDCLSYENLGRLMRKEATINPPTAGAVLDILAEHQIDLVGKNVVVIGAGLLVGRPLAILLMNARASVTTVNSKTKDIKKKCQAADIIVMAVGKPNILRGNMIKKGAIVIDTGVSFPNGKLSGDINFAEISKKASIVTPTPGGVGPITIARLLANVVTAAEDKTRFS